MTDNNNNKRGRKSVFTDSEFIDVLKNSNSVNDIIEGFKVLAEQFTGQRKETYDKWIANKTDKQLKLFVSIRSSNLRSKGFLPSETRFKPGPKKLEAVVNGETTVHQEQEPIAVVLE